MAALAPLEGVWPSLDVLFFQEDRQGVYIIEQQRVGIHGVDMAYISVMIPSSHELHDVSMRRQQALGLLELSWREHKKIFSHMMDDVAGVEEGTLIVQRD